jgi:hypothetical protein
MKRTYILIITRYVFLLVGYLLVSDGFIFNNNPIFARGTCCATIDENDVKCVSVMRVIFRLFVLVSYVIVS